MYKSLIMLLLTTNFFSPTTSRSTSLVTKISTNHSLKHHGHVTKTNIRLSPKSKPPANQIGVLSQLMCLNGTCMNETVAGYNVQSQAVVTPNGIIYIRESEDQHKGHGKSVSLHPTIIGVSTVVAMYCIFLLLYYLFSSRKNKMASQFSAGKCGSVHDIIELESEDTGTTGVIGARAGKNLWQGSPKSRNDPQLTTVNNTDSPSLIKPQITIVKPKCTSTPVLNDNKKPVKRSPVTPPLTLNTSRKKNNTTQIISSADDNAKSGKLVCPVIYIEDDYQIRAESNGGVKSKAAKRDNSVYIGDKQCNSNKKFNTFKMDYLTVPLDIDEVMCDLACSNTPPVMGIKRKLSYREACSDSFDNEDAQLSLIEDDLFNKSGSCKAELPGMDSVTGASSGLQGGNLHPPQLNFVRRHSYQRACDEDIESEESMPNTPCFHEDYLSFPDPMLNITPQQPTVHTPPPQYPQTLLVPKIQISVDDEQLLIPENSDNISRKIAFECNNVSIDLQNGTMDVHNELDGGNDTPSIVTSPGISAFETPCRRSGVGNCFVMKYSNSNNDIVTPCIKTSDSNNDIMTHCMKPSNSIGTNCIQSSDCTYAIGTTCCVTCSQSSPTLTVSDNEKVSSSERIRKISYLKACADQDCVELLANEADR